MAQATANRVLIVEADAELARRQRQRLESAGCTVLAADTPPAALALLRQQEVDLILAAASGLEGLAFLDELKSAGFNTPVILVTAFDNDAALIQARRAGVFDLLGRSDEFLDYLPEAVERVLRQVRSERQSTEAARALQRSEELFHQVWDRSLDGMRLTDEHGIILRVNQAFCNLVGKPREELERQPLTVAHAASEHQPVLDRHRRRFALRQVESVVEKEAVLWNGKKVHLELSNSFLQMPGERLALLSIIRDVTQRINLEQQLLHSQKLEAVGRLSGGVAHDFNNLLTVILGYADKLAAESAANEALLASVKEIRLAAERAAALTRQLLLFSRKQVAQPRVLDLNSVVSNLGAMLARLIGEDIQVSQVLASGLWPVHIDPTQAEQVIINLAVNARDALLGVGGGSSCIVTDDAAHRQRVRRLTIETVNVELGEPYVSAHPEARPGRHVLLAVSDTGCGMTEEVKRRAFEPFFTTKEEGKGSGLGLATVLGIVKQSGGHVAVYSEPGHGSTFKVYLPAIAAPAAPAEQAEQMQPQPARGTETVLVVEDEPSVRLLVRLVLAQHGYTVLEASEATEAIRLAEQHSGPIHLVLTDFVLPGMNGADLARRLRQGRPATRLLYMSGYTGGAITERGVLDRDVLFLQKPFTSEALLRLVREVLDGG
jgi:two-component system cell cycle sensor histidine kinase/response regulator CckA